VENGEFYITKISVKLTNHLILYIHTHVVQIAQTENSSENSKTYPFEEAKRGKNNKMKLRKL
jgi:hypothetical protein